MTSLQRLTDNNAFELSPFILEWFAGNRPPNQLPISAVCNCHCLFCSNELNPFPIVKGTFRDIEDIKLQLSAMAANDDPIRLSDSLPGRISEGEALLHPKLFEILELVRRKFFYNQLCFTTNGSLLDDAFVKRLAAFKPIQITLSMHSTIPELWAHIFKKNKQSAEIAIAAPPLLKRYGMEMIGTIVPLPNVCDWDDLDRTYEYLVTNGAKEMILYWPGYTVRTPGALVKELECSIDEFTAYAERMKKRYDIPVNPFPDMITPLNIAVKTIIDKTLRGNPKTRGGAYQRVIWLSSKAAFTRLREMVATHAAVTLNKHNVIPTENLTYGGNIIAAGLLMAEDFTRAGQAAMEEWPDADLFLVPANPFDSLLRDLIGIPAYQIAERLRRPVWLVQSDGVIDPMLSTRLVKRRRPLESGLKKAMNKFNLARVDEEKLGEGLDIVAFYPIATPRGLLNREQLGIIIREERGRTAELTPILQRFEVLDEVHALCLETWMLRSSEQPLHRWTRLAKKTHDWFIESIEEGSAK